MSPFQMHPLGLIIRPDLDNPYEGRRNPQSRRRS